MDDKRLHRLKTIMTGVLVFFPLWLHPLPAVPLGIRSIEKIALDGQSGTLTIRIGGKVPIKVFQIGEKEIVIALKDAQLQKKASKDGIESRLVKRIQTEALPGNIVVLNVYLSDSVKAVQPEWIDGEKTLQVRLLSDRVPKPAPQPAPQVASDIRFPELSIGTVEALDWK